MAKEWVLNQATNRWGLNKKNCVGPTSMWIRESAPDSAAEWRIAYLEKLQGMLRDKEIDLAPMEYLRGLGAKLYVKITEVVQAEIEDVTEADCIGYIQQLVIDRLREGSADSSTT